MKKKFYKNNVGCYYFYDVSIYQESLKESCLSYEKLVNEFEKICNFLEKWAVLEISYKKIIKFLDTFYK